VLKVFQKRGIEIVEEMTVKRINNKEKREILIEALTDTKFHVKHTEEQNEQNEQNEH